MTSSLAVIVFLGVAVAYANGSNDVSKGIATLVGSGVTDLRRAIRWGWICTGAGAIASAFAARAMIATFGAGLLERGIHPTWLAALATLAGASLWVGFSTWKSLPVSTTHAIIGSLAGVGIVAYGSAGIRWSAFGDKLLLPLLLSPFLAFGLTWLIVTFWKDSPTAISAGDCLCVTVEPTVSLSALGTGGEATAMFSAPTMAPPLVSVGRCDEPQPTATFALNMDSLHWLTSGATSFARGLNDTPKMVALLLAASAVSGQPVPSSFSFFAVIAAGIVLGSWIAGRRVTQVLAHDVTAMSYRQGFVANLVTAALVGPAAALGLPMSTTHVASGAIIGIAGGRATNWTTVRTMVLAWILTLPGAAFFGIAILLLLRLSGWS